MSIDMNTISDEWLIPAMERVVLKVADQKDGLVADGVKAFNRQSEFVEGKVINAFSIVVVNNQQRADFEVLLTKLRETFHFVAAREFSTWGILNCITGIYRLQTAGLLERVLVDEDLELLKKKLTWREFVDSDFQLIHKPTNYYGVAFGIARYRELLHWSDEKHSEHLLKLLISHIEDYSGTQKFMDDTPGDGRFDRYSILVPAELSNLLTETGQDVPEFLKTMLIESANICLSLANVHGDGFKWGRSVDAYGESAILEILSIANRMKLLHGENKELAFDYCEKVIAKLQNYWFDDETGYINFWDRGRRTDGYRNKNRILGETLSIQIQTLHSIGNLLMNPLAKRSTKTMDELMQKLPEYQLIEFDHHHGPKSLVIVRKHGFVFVVPFINGGSPLYKTSPYFPMPMAARFLQYTPNRLAGHLVPLIDSQGGQYFPIARFDNITATKKDDDVVVNFSTKSLCNIVGDTPKFESGFEYQGSYTFSDNGLTIEGDVVSQEKRIEEISLRLPLFTSAVGHNVDTFIYADANLHGIKTNGFNDVSETTYALDLDTPDGPHQSMLIMKKHVHAQSCHFKVVLTF